MFVFFNDLFSCPICPECGYDKLDELLQDKEVLTNEFRNGYAGT